MIGDPPVGGLADSLEAAYVEAVTVGKTLHDGGYDVEELCYDQDRPLRRPRQPRSRQHCSRTTTESSMLPRTASTSPDDPTRTGIAIGPDDFLTASMFRQLNVIPDVVFLNCCHLGAVAFGIEHGAVEFTRRNLDRLGASLARELIDCGVRAVVVAGWAVHDRAAAAFATSFYRAMLNGSTFRRRGAQQRVGRHGERRPSTAPGGHTSATATAGTRCHASEANNGTRSASRSRGRSERPSDGSTSWSTASRASAWKRRPATTARRPRTS